ncbi:hypothetical protein GCM10010191_34760 [Actinomadura vinacea]|uniref:DUF397 domain-containing protein n=2 Tax=Actinomadura vinacea TaxID=115336 RepID=A0ABN3J391_9ACTN
MASHETTPAIWRKSSRSGSTGGECVEVARIGVVNAVRDSKDPEGGVLAVGGQVWAGLLAEIKRGAYDSRLRRECRRRLVSSRPWVWTSSWTLFWVCQRWFSMTGIRR